MREYAPLAVVVAAVGLLCAVAYQRFAAPSPEPPAQAEIVLTVDAELAGALRQNQATLALLAAGGKSEGKATVTRWSLRGGNTLVIQGYSAPHGKVAYRYLIVYWSNGSASLHDIDVTLEGGARRPS